MQCNLQLLFPATKNNSRRLSEIRSELGLLTCQLSVNSRDSAENQVMSRSFKHREFVREPMGNKPVQDVPGIGEVIGRNMERAGIMTAKALYAHYLADPGKFMDKVMSFGANVRQQNAAFNAMRDYANQHN